MRLVLLLSLLTACGSLPADQLPDGGGPTGACVDLGEAACLTRDDCHASFQVTQCRNILGYCAQFLTCADEQANCTGPANCDIVEPFCAGPYVISYTQTCYGGCVRADQCAGCQDAKLTFTQADACANDGSVEFCIEPVLAEAIQQIAPTASCAPGGGRAGCDPATQLLCQFPTGASECVAPGGAVTDEAWDTVCGITMLPGVIEIVPTIFR